MTAIPTIRQIPVPVPQRSDMENFSERGDRTLTALPGVIDDMNNAIEFIEYKVLTLPETEEIKDQVTTARDEAQIYTTLALNAANAILEHGGLPPLAEGALGSAFEPTGSYMDFAGPARLADGWILCDGSAYLKASYPDLFDVIGYRYTGPDLLDRISTPSIGNIGAVYALAISSDERYLAVYHTTSPFLTVYNLEIKELCFLPSDLTVVEPTYSTENSFPVPMSFRPFTHELHVGGFVFDIEDRSLIKKRETPTPIQWIRNGEFYLAKSDSSASVPKGSLMIRAGDTGQIVKTYTPDKLVGGSYQESVYLSDSGMLLSLGTSSSNGSFALRGLYLHRPSPTDPIEFSLIKSFSIADGVWRGFYFPTGSSSRLSGVIPSQDGRFIALTLGSGNNKTLHVLHFDASTEELTPVLLPSGQALAGVSSVIFDPTGTKLLITLSGVSSSICRVINIEYSEQQGAYFLLEDERVTSFDAEAYTAAWVGGRLVVGGTDFPLGNVALFESEATESDEFRVPDLRSASYRFTHVKT